MPNSKRLCKYGAFSYSNFVIVRPPVTLQYCVRTAKHIEFFSYHSSIFGSPSTEALNTASIKQDHQLSLTDLRVQTVLGVFH